MGEEMENRREIFRLVEGMLVRIAQAISSACNFISVRMDYYVEIKQYEFETRNKTFPKEWFENLPNEEE
jgi:NADH:ubiquinone oxidoreductase subunit F (NADH-binding)